MSFIAELKRRNVIRVAAAYVVAGWLIVEIGSALADIYGAPGWTLKMLVGLLTVGFPIALLFSWAYELTSEGLKREKDVVREDSITPITAKRLDKITIGLIVLVGAFVLVDRFVFERSEEPVPTPPLPPADVNTLALGVAVLPFDNLSEDTSNAFFASGVHEDVLIYLSRVADLRVISRTSVETYADSDLTLPEIGRELGVSHVVEGSVRRAGNSVRVSVQLIDATTDQHVWAENYDRTLDASSPSRPRSRRPSSRGSRPYSR